MKTNIRILLLTALIGFSSCNQWLDVVPENEQVADEYWKNKEQVEAIIAAIYIKYRTTVKDQIVWGEDRANSISPNIVGGDELDIMRWNILPDNEYCKWGKWYQIINLCNMVIRYAPGVADPSFPEEAKNATIAEATYLRALAYFFLVRNFRDVPLILEPYMNDSQNYEIPKSPESEIWAQIKADLLFAEQNIKDSYSASEQWMNKGRATKLAVKATLADVYLWTEEYDKAIIACNDVIGSGKVGLIQGLTGENENNWFTLFNPGNSNESIFELQWDNLQGQSNSNLYNMFNGTSYDYQISLTLYMKFLQSYNDIRGLNATYTMMPALRVWKYIGSNAGNHLLATEIGAERTSGEQDQNWIMYRFADVLLMKAEALIMKEPGNQTNYAEAVDIVNTIKERAQVTNLITDIPQTELEMLEMVMDERSLELAIEGKRWYDLLRVGKRNNYQYLNYMIDEVLKNISPEKALIVQSILRNKDSHYLPIHFDELTNNKELVQNPYYESLK
ncbi:RagB/SusD family nutrient uptake outer membrane protein [Saccharicrinis sp. FJH62]|uniref:RagB/SusD family nutrient uptake outer membrane protein n=1 Tax=Saccharicrinis sp. FJH62 TaxID=3344657 RepID=UPI0035D446ED